MRMEKLSLLMESILVCLFEISNGAFIQIREFMQIAYPSSFVTIFQSIFTNTGTLLWFILSILSPLPSFFAGDGSVRSETVLPETVSYSSLPRPNSSKEGMWDDRRGILHLLPSCGCSCLVCETELKQRHDTKRLGQRYHPKFQLANGNVSVNSCVLKVVRMRN